MRKTTGFYYLIIGVVIGAIIFGGATAIAASAIANPKTAAVVIDGENVDLKGYLVEGNHYFQLRDLSAALRSGGKDFGVEWDGQGNRVIIDTSKGYYRNESLPSPSSAPTEPVTTLDGLKAELIRLTNVERVKAGLPELQALPELMGCAQAKADDMRINSYYGHDSPVYGSCFQMIRDFVPNVRWCSENLAPWMVTPEETVAAWLDSSGHRGNLLESRATHVGVGLYERGGGGYTWVMQFAQI